MNNPLHMLKGRNSLRGVLSGLHRVNPFREWLIGLVTAVCVIVLGGAYALQLFFTGYTDAPVDGTVTSERIHYDAEKVREVLDAYNARKAEAELYESEKVYIPPTPVTADNSEGNTPTVPVAQKPDVQVE